METARQTILDHATQLVMAHGEVPSLNALAIAAGVSKGGLMHHFPTRDALLRALAVDAIAAVDAALEKSEVGIELLRTWLKLSIPDDQGVVLFQSMASVFFKGKSRHGQILSLSNEANQRWETSLAEALGSAEAARAARLLGDGLLFGSISGTITGANAAAYLQTAEQAVDSIAKATR
jgi:AcrR family transcriptional regulator